MKGKPVIAGTAAVLLALALAMVGWILAPNLYDAPAPSGNLTVDATREATRSQAIVTTRASVLAALAGLGALVTIAINYRNSATANRNSAIAAETLATTNRTFEITARGHLTDRYTKAIEQLGDKESLAIRLGGIYALQQFAIETDRIEDQTTVVEVLSAFVRINPPPRAAADNDPSLAGTTGDQSTDARAAAGEPRPDVLAAISALAQLPDRTELRADFSGVDFSDVLLTPARLRGGILRDISLVRARFQAADLRDADLTNATLAYAHFDSANLAGSRLAGAILYRAQCHSANFRGANLVNAKLPQANLIKSDLTDADLTDANLADADLTHANLAGANLAGAQIRRGQLSDEQLTAARNVPEPIDEPDAPLSTD